MLLSEDNSLVEFYSQKMFPVWKVFMKLYLIIVDHH